VFLLPSLVVGVAFAYLLGGRPGRLLQLELRRGWAVFLALGIQIVIFTRLGDGIPHRLDEPLHLASYGLLVLFAASNSHRLALVPLFAGMVLNAAAIAANGGEMPVSPAAWHAAGLADPGRSNVRLGAANLSFFGDVFALPKGFPFANVFSLGDLLIGAGMVAFMVAASSTPGSEPLLAPRRLVQPLRNPSFRRLAGGKLVSHLGDWLTLAALIGWIYAATGSTGQVALLMLVRMTPPIIGAGFAAALVDRLPRGRLLVRIEAARAGSVGLALLAVVVGSHPLAFGSVGLLGALAAMSAANVRSLVPGLLTDDEFPAANAGLGIAQDAAMAVGALGAGLALSTSTAALALAVALVPFGLAVLAYSGVEARPQPIPREGADQGLGAGIRYLLRRRLLLVVVLAFGSATLATGLTNATLPRFLDAELGLGAGSYGFGLAALAGGLALGEAVVGVARIGETGGRWIGAALALMAALFLCLAYTKHGPTALLFLGLIGFLDGTTDVLFDTIVQREADPRFYGRVFGFASIFMMSTMMGAVATAPLLNDLASSQTVILCGAACLIAASVTAFAGTRPGGAGSPAPAGVGSGS